jgi:hypothetical protein
MQDQPRRALRRIDLDAPLRELRVAVAQLERLREQRVARALVLVVPQHRPFLDRRGVEHRLEARLARAVAVDPEVDGRDEHRSPGFTS